MRDDHAAAGPVTAFEAREILSRFNASHFRLHDYEHARYTIPADPRRDDDIRLGAFIAQSESEIANLRSRLAAAERVVEAARRMAFFAERETMTFEEASDALVEAIYAYDAAVRP